MNLSKLEKILKPYPPYRFRQAQEAVFRRLIESWDEATDLPPALRQELNIKCPLIIKAKIQQSTESDTLKAAIKLRDGAVIETVLMRHRPTRNTVCLSSQVGCLCACDFCATGKMGFVRQMKAEEIAEQALFFARLLKKEGQKISNAVFMGMGEPFLNYDEVMKAVGYLNDKDKFNLGARHISISTVGVIEGIERLSREKRQVNLALSLHAPNDDLRGELMPFSLQYPLKDVLSALKKYIQSTGRRVMIEYVLLKDVNDSPEMAKSLAKLLRQFLGKLFFVNLISFNLVGRYRPSSPEAIKKFKDILEKERIAVTCRYRFGGDIRSACGQLAGQNRL